MFIAPPLAVSAWYIALWAVLASVFAASVWMARSQWGQRRPLARCVLWSLAAHAVLIAIAATIRFVNLPPGAGEDEPVRVTIVASLPQPSTTAPDQHASTPNVAEEQTVDDVSPPDAETDQSEQPQPAPLPQTEPDLAPPDLMPEPTSDNSTEQLADSAVRPAPIAQSNEASATQVAATASSEREAAPDDVQQPQPATPPAPDVVPAKPAVPASLAQRVRPDRLKSVIEQGGSRETEQAVGLALEWLADAQSRDGRWDADRWQGGREFQVLGHNRNGAGKQADTAVTGLALLTFLGAGHTHLAGPYQHQVAGGLAFLINSQDAQGNMGSGCTFYARTYSHSMATFALAEAYAMTADKRLEPSVRRAVNYLLGIENRSYGGWRYKSGDQGDVSQLGWIIMALRSAEVAGVAVPEDTWRRIDYFLNRVARGQSGGLAAYQAARGNWSRPMTAEAMYCRQVLGEPLAGAALGEALAALDDELPGDKLTNYYYWYYATLALHHAQHDNRAAAHTWSRWNDRLKRELVAAQVSDGSNAGSWSPNTVWGGYGGRVYTTAMAAMCLEVYYRYGSTDDHGSPWVASRPRDDSPVK